MNRRLQTESTAPPSAAGRSGRAAVLAALHVQLLELRLQVDEIDAVFHTGGGGVQVGADGARSAEVDADGLDEVRVALLLRVHAAGGGREAEDTKAVDVHRVSVVELGPHGGDEVGQHAADVAQRQRARRPSSAAPACPAWPTFPRR